MMIQSTQLCDFVVPPGLPCVAFCEAGPSTTVENPLQISYFIMQNEPNFRKVKLNVNKEMAREYAKKTLGQHGKNEPKTNPIRTQSKPIKANFPAPRGETNPIQTQYKPNLLNAQMNVTSFLTKDYENVPLRRRGENKPNQTQFQFSTMLNCAICSAAISTDKSFQQPLVLLPLSCGLIYLTFRPQRRMSS